MITFLIIVLVLVGLFLRYNWVFKIRIKAINIVYGKHSPVDWRVYQRTTFREQMWDIRKWTFKQFFPELVKEKR